MNSLSKKRILAVDDEPILRMLLSDMLSEAGYSVDLAENGEVAMELLMQDASYDLLIVDMDMPKMDGVSLCRKTKEYFPALKQRFLFITGCIGEDAALFFKENNYKHMTKPFKTSDLLNQIDYVIAEGAITKREGVDRRSEKRFPWSAYCEIFDGKTYNHTPLLAKTEDISQNGARIKYVDKPLAFGDNVSIRIKNLNIQRAAKIVWSKAINELDSLAGMRFTEPVKMPPAIENADL